jgi:hypothetical protein
MDTNRVLMIAAAVILALILVWFLLPASPPTEAPTPPATTQTPPATREQPPQ